MPRPFRFGTSLLNVGSLASWRDRVRQAEDLGYDVLQVPDHAGMLAPLPALVAAADATSIRLGTYVLNVGLVSPAYLARDVADVYRLTEGRLELGLGAGGVPADFEAAGLPFGTPAQRLRKLDKTLTELHALLAKEPDHPNPPIMLSGFGDRMLQLAGREADIFSFSIQAGFSETLAPHDAFARRVELLRQASDGRDVELNLFIAAVGATVDTVDLTVLRQISGMTDDQLVQLPGVLLGSPQQIADRLQRYREEFGVNYISVIEPHMTVFAEVIKLLR
ncbi:TIGR03621 family F420-dependent LLM class oxidoreductase [Kibdelosporangium philippinense]|uniref:TIGR03621 family F420-dependent LLM class oxidoreductase n=1 Tax=Kibdelosporangium philippinense TaxID=211113 RepID=A0ABS8ZAA5_9PSEU|nr:TIGR03621 family F420-dependent LLM class oxidoreductase [Kibdelosporangium philippinense]MCE7003973.1 TIGR03621 family F420-dependent LLM class oxidoreductase [Kibdelosporangium philippinense]